MDRLGTSVAEPGVPGEDTRKAYWATTFRALGDVIHLVQDMAQPQHTRSEIHPLGMRKEFENYIEARAIAELQPTYVWKNLGIELKYNLSPLSYFSPAGLALTPPAYASHPKPQAPAKSRPRSALGPR